MSLVSGGMRHLVPGVRAVSWLEMPEMRLGEDDFRARTTRWVRLIVLHTTMGTPGKLVAGAGPRGGAKWVIEDQRARRDVHAGEHAIIDCDGTVYQACDLLTEAAYHAGSLNEVSIGIELKQDARGALYEEQIAALMRLLDWLTAYFGIQRQYQWPYHGEDHAISRLVAGGKDCVGIVGHRDQTGLRSVDDPGPFPYLAMHGAGYESVDMARGEDLDRWRGRQAQLGLLGADMDGIPGPKTVIALRKAGHEHGLWVRR